MKAQFKTEQAAVSFMSFLANKNNQGVKQVLFGWANDGENVDYQFNQILHDDLIENVSDYLATNEGK